MTVTRVVVLMEILRMLRSHKGEIVTGTVERLTGHPPRTFETWCQDHASDFR